MKKSYEDFYEALNKHLKKKDKQQMPEDYKETVQYVLDQTYLDRKGVDAVKYRFGICELEPWCDISDIELPMPYAEIAQLLGSTEGKIKGRIRNVMEKCAKSYRRDILGKGLAACRAGDAGLLREKFARIEERLQEINEQIRELENEAVMLRKDKSALVHAFAKSHKICESGALNIAEGLPMETPAKPVEKCCGTCRCNCMEDDDTEPVCNNRDSGAYKKPMVDEESCEFWM